MGRVAGQVDQDVDVVCSDALRKLIIGKLLDVLPVDDQLAQVRRNVIIHPVVTIDVQFESACIDQVFQHWRDEVGHGMVVQVGRDKANAQHALGIAFVGVLRPLGKPGRF